jgi:glycosyltransferase involved in cell wall biosynthesis
VTLQGDDIFLSGLPEPYQSQALGEIRRLAGYIDAYITHSQFYADHMADYLGLDRDKIHIIPLGIETRDFQARAADTRPPTVGYLARVAPAKGLHILAAAFIALKKMQGTENARLKIAGWLGDNDRDYFSEVIRSLDAAGLGSAVEYLGEVDRKAKVELLSSIDVLAVPTTYREPKGLFVLEALAAGVPVVLPDHGAFPEVLEDTQGGLLHRPEDSQHLAERLHELLTNHERRRQLANIGRIRVDERRSAEVMAGQTADLLSKVVRGHQPSGRSS